MDTMICTPLTEEQKRTATEFYDKGILYVGEDDTEDMGCLECAFGNKPCGQVPQCLPADRDDNRSIIFKEVQL
jgi:hypothetical protein